MLFDINAAIGHWPFRQIPNNSASDLRRVLERAGIGGAAVAHTHAIFYKNVHDANIELDKEIQSHHDFFIGVATLNPKYPCWASDLDHCVNEFGFRALRLLPYYHNYCLDSPEALAIVKKASSLGIPVIIPFRIVDYRQSHWLDVESFTDPVDVIELCKAVPEANIIYTDSSVEPECFVDTPNCFLGISRMFEALEKQIGRGVDLLGPERLLFGTDAPFKGVSAAVLKLERVEIATEKRRAIASGNALSLLGVDGNLNEAP